jgi:hypothetical protein
VSNRRAQDERIEGTPDGSNAISEIVDVPDAPTIGTATPGLLNASVAFTPATTGGTVSLFTATSTPGSITGTSATSPITVNGLTGGTEYTFTVRGANSTGTGPSSSASNSATPEDLVGVYDALATVNLSTTTATVTFAGIPSGYKHLQLRLTTSTNRPTYGINAIGMDSFSGDIAANYSGHFLEGDGSTIYASGAANGTGFNIGQTGTGVVGNFGVAIIDILDYSNTSKYKTVRCASGTDSNGAVAGYNGTMGLYSGSWRSFNALTSLRFYLSNNANFTQYSSFAVYGVK